MKHSNNVDTLVWKNYFAQQHLYMNGKLFVEHDFLSFSKHFQALNLFNIVVFCSTHINTHTYSSDCQTNVDKEFYICIRFLFTSFLPDCQGKFRKVKNMLNLKCITFLHSAVHTSFLSEEIHLMI